MQMTIKMLEDERKRSRSLQTQKHRMQEGRRYECAEEWSPEFANSTSNTIKLHLK